MKSEPFRFNEQAAPLDKDSVQGLLTKARVHLMLELTELY